MHQPVNAAFISLKPMELTGHKMGVLYGRMHLAPNSCAANVYRSHRKCLNLCAGLSVGDAAEMRQVHELQDLCSTGDMSSNCSYIEAFGGSVTLHV